MKHDPGLQTAPFGSPVQLIARAWVVVVVALVVVEVLVVGLVVVVVEVDVVVVVVVVVVTVVRVVDVMSRHVVPSTSSIYPTSQSQCD